MPPFKLFDRRRLVLRPLAERKSDFHVDQMLPVVKSSEAPDWARVLGCRLTEARQRGAAHILFMGAHAVKNGLSGYLLSLLEQGAFDHLAVNGAVVVHDYELALAGQTSEDVACNLHEGTFGLWQETARLNDIIREGAGHGLGLGQAVGRAILKEGMPFTRFSLLADCVRLGIPVTVHVSIGQDILHEHPGCDGAATGQASYHDFLVFAQTVTRLEGGVLLNLGSAVTGPEVFLKALAMARNTAHQEGGLISRFTTAVFDLAPLGASHATKDDPLYYNRAWKTILTRSVASGGESFHVQGDMRQTIPQLYSALA